MKITTFFLFVLVSFTCQSFAQDEEKASNKNQNLLQVKSILEKHFAGTNIRSLQKGFEIKLTATKGYSFISEINGFFSEKTNKNLSSKLNKVLKLKNNTKLTGTLYFDDCLDSAFVNIEYKREDTVYSFISMSGYAVPRGGFNALSKRLHNFIKEQIALGKLAKDSVLSVKSINLLVDRSGSFKQYQQNYLSKVIDKFLASEPRWNPSMGGGRPLSTVVNFSIIQYYINGDSWPREDNIAKRYQDNNDFEGYVNIYTIAFFHHQNIPVFYSYNLLPNSGKTTISAVYDNILKEYRMFVIHDGALNHSKQLITLIRKEASKKIYPLEFNFRRVYFMLD